MKNSIPLVAFAFVITLLSVSAVKTAADPPGKPKSVAKPVFSGLQAVGKRLDQIGVAIIKGEGADLEKAWGSWQLSPPHKFADRARKQLETARTKLGDAGTTRLQNLGFEFRLWLLKSNKQVYVLNGFLILDQKQASLLKFSGNRRNGPVIDPMQPKWSGEVILIKHGAVLPKELKGPDRNFAEVFESFLKAVRSEERARLTLADLDVVAKSMMLPPILAPDIKKQMTNVKLRFATICQELAKLEYDTVGIEIEDQAFLARDAKGQSLGVLQGRFAVLDKKWIYVVDGFRPFPKSR